MAGCCLIGAPQWPKHAQLKLGTTYIYSIVNSGAHFCTCIPLELVSECPLPECQLLKCQLPKCQLPKMSTPKCQLPKCQLLICLRIPSIAHIGICIAITKTYFATKVQLDVQ